MYPAFLSADPLPDNASHKPVATHGYRLVTPPSSNREDVEFILAKVRAEIPGAEVVTVIEKKVYYRLEAGRFSDVVSARRLRSALAKRNITSFIARSANGYSVIVGSHGSEQLAVAEQKLLARKRIAVTIVTANLSAPQWQINSTDSYELRDAVYTASIMAMKGMITTIEDSSGLRNKISVPAPARLK